MIEHLWIIWLIPAPWYIYYTWCVIKNWNLHTRDTSNIEVNSPFIIFQFTAKHVSDVLVNSVNNVHYICKEAKYDKYRVDVVVDYISDIDINANVIVVPELYETPNVSKHKSRALHYMVEYHRENNDISDNCWIFHMDEESILTNQCLLATLDFTENSDKLIGIGAIVYPQKFSNASLLTRSADSIRPFGSFEHIQQTKRRNSPPLYFQGSNMICRSDIEDAVGYDFGNVIAEDSIFGHAAFNKFGNIIGWHGGLLEEQPVFNLRDHFKQRSRWYIGLKQSLKLPFLSLRHKVEVVIRLMSWSMGFIAGLVTILSLFYFELFGIYRFLLFPLALIWISAYQIGMYLNTRSLMISKIDRIKNHIYLLMVTPIIGFIECFPAIISLFSNRQDFEIVEK